MTYDVMDETGKVRGWAERDGAVLVWENHDLGSRAGDVVTPIDSDPPSWRYPTPRTVLASDLRYFMKGGIVFVPGRGLLEWSDTPVGRRSAERMVSTLPEHNGRDCKACTRSGLPTEKTPACVLCDGTGIVYPPMRLAFRYTVERVSYATAEADSMGRPLGVHFRQAIVRWSLVTNP